MLSALAGLLIGFELVTFRTKKAKRKNRKLKTEL
jgi:uncharacterized integral membrane protein